MKKNTLAWFVIAGASIALSGVVACSSSSATGNAGDDDDSSSNDAGSDATIKNDGSTGGDSGGGDAGADSSCGSTPTLHTTTDDAGRSDIFCSPATGPAAYCQIEAGTDNTCCIDTSGTGFPDGQCTTKGSCAAGSLELDCLDDNGCPTGEKCYGLGGAYVLKACNYQKVFAFKGTQCAANSSTIDATDAGHFEVCSNSKGCSNGAATCVPTKEYVQFGVCSEL